MRKPFKSLFQKAGMGFFVIGDRSQWFLGNFFKVSEPDRGGIR
jgi:hypothetical protein